MKLSVVIGSGVGRHHGNLAREALMAAARARGHRAIIRHCSFDGSEDPQSADETGLDDVIIAVSVNADKLARLTNKLVVATRVSDVILNTDAVIDRAAVVSGAAVRPALRQGLPADAKSSRAARVVAVTACPTGVAHTFMAAEALRRAAADRGVRIAIETQGSVGTKGALSIEDISNADAVVIAADIHVDETRFAKKKVLRTSTKEALRDAARVIERALAERDVSQAVVTHRAPWSRASLQAVASLKTMYRHLITGVSYMLPMVTAGGLLVALSFMVGGLGRGDHAAALGGALMQIGGGAAFSLYVPFLAGFIAYSVADRPGLVPGFIGGSLATGLGAGFIGGIIGGLLAGFTCASVTRMVRVPHKLEALKSVLIVPVLSTVVVGLAMIFLIGAPAKFLMAGLTARLTGMQEANGVLLGLLLGCMMAVDMGGPVNKSAYAFAVAVMASKVYGPIAVAMAAGMTPPLGIAVATVLAPRLFTEEERAAGRVAAILGLSFVTEGAIPFAAKDPLRVIPATMLGSGTAGALVMLAGVRLMVPHGGAFSLLIPHAVDGLGMYTGAIAIGSVVTGAALVIAKRRL